MRRPSRGTPVRGGVPGRVHHPRPGAPGVHRGAHAEIPLADAQGERRMKSLRRVLLMLSVMLLCATPALASNPSPAGGSAKRPGHAAIASAHKLATEAGLEILREGGNAFDAAVAVASTLSVVEPQSSGIGGGGFFLLHRASDGKDVMLDARETAPAASSSKLYEDANGNPDAR